jgi:transcriptional regulator with XRE-family HTH domain
MKLRSTQILVAFMESKNFSVTRLAQYAGCSRSMIGHLRSGEKSSCTPGLAERIAEALDVPLVALFEERAPTSSRQIAPRRIVKVA